MMKGLRKICYLFIILLSGFITYGCGKDTYKMEDFGSIQKIDAHIHDNTEGTAFLDLAVKDRFKLLSINVDYPDFPGVNVQQKAAMMHLKSHPDVFAYSSTFFLYGWDDPDWVNKTLSHLDSTFEKGSIAVKFWKNIGMVFRDKDSNYIMLDDQKLEPVFSALIKKNIPIIVHCGEPRDCWLPVEKMMSNDMKIYFSNHPHYHMYLHPEMPSYMDQINARNKVLEKHPDMKFMGAHIGSLEWSIDEVANFLDKYPNAKVDLAARMDYVQIQSQKDRDKVHKFFCDYKDRIIYGTDLIINPADDPKLFQQVAHDKWLSDWKYLATDSTMTVPAVKGEFKGLELPKDVINSIYYSNAKKLFSSAWK